MYKIVIFLYNYFHDSLRQEGWRLEHTQAKDPATPIIFKGVVYNEMKGVFVSNLDFIIF